MDKENISELTQQTVIGLLDFVTATKDFVLEQAPLYARELVTWQMWDGIVCGTIFLLIFFVSILGFCTGIKIIKNDKHDEGFACIMVGITVALISIFISTKEYRSAIKAVLAPRVVIIEHLQSKLK